MATDRNLVAALKDVCREAWLALNRENPTEFFYAFGLFTTPAAEYFVPFACGEEALKRVARRYVDEGSFATEAEAVARVRWSPGDSPYRERLEAWSEAASGALAARPDSFAMDEVKAVREDGTRLSSAVAALKELDAEGVFDTDGRRSGRVLLIEAGDRSDDFVLKYAKKLNPPEVFAAYRKQIESPGWGRYVEVGTKKVYQTESIAVCASGPWTESPRVFAAADEMVVSLDPVGRRQLWHAAIRHGGKVLTPFLITAPPDGGFLAAAARGWDGHFLAVWDDASDARSVSLHQLGFAPASIGTDRAGSIVVLSGNDGHVHVFSPAGHELAAVECKGDRVGVDVSADGRRIAAAGGTEGTRLWEADGTGWRAAGSIPTPAHDVRFAPDGGTLATAVRWGLESFYDPRGRDRLLQWDVASGRQIGGIRVDGYYLFAPAFDRTGGRIACCAQEPYDEHRSGHMPAQECLVLDAGTGRLLDRLRLPVHVDRFNRVEFIDDRTLAIAAWGHTLRPLLVWTLESGPSSLREM